jgi:hypothetical protein
MKRRTALITSAAVSVVVLGGTVAAAAWSGAGLLGFGSGSSPVAAPADSAGDVLEGADSSVSTSAPGTTVQVRVVEDRIVVRAGGSSTGGDAVLGRLGANSTGQESAGTGADSNPSTTSTTVPSTRGHSDDEHESEHEDEYESEYEHDEEHESEHEYEDD